MQNPFQSQTGDKLSYFYKFLRIKLPNTQFFANNLNTLKTQIIICLIFNIEKHEKEKNFRF